MATATLDKPANAGADNPATIPVQPAIPTAKKREKPVGPIGKVFTDPAVASLAENVVSSPPGKTNQYTVWSLVPVAEGKPTQYAYGKTDMEAFFYIVGERNIQEWEAGKLVDETKCPGNAKRQFKKLCRLDGKTRGKTAVLKANDLPMLEAVLKLFDSSAGLTKQNWDGLLEMKLITRDGLGNINGGVFAPFLVAKADRPAIPDLADNRLAKLGIGV